MQWKGNTIGEYQGPGLIGPILEKFRRNLFDLDQINRLLEKAGPVKCLNLYRGMTNWCPCGEIDMSSRDLIGHCMDYHRGIAMRNSQLNRPPWIDWVEYDDDEVMEKLCFTDESLDKYINNNYRKTRCYPPPGAIRHLAIRHLFKKIPDISIRHPIF